MGVIAVIAYERLASLPRWQAYHLHGRQLPAEHVRALLPQFRRWIDYVRPILSSEGNLVGLWVSNRMSRRRWHRLRALAEPFLVSNTAAPPPNPVPEDESGQPRILSLEKCGLYVPRSKMDHLILVLKQLGGIEITADDDLNGECLLVPEGRSLKGLYAALEVAVEPIPDHPDEQVAPSRRRHLLELLREAIADLDPRAS